MYEQFVSQTHFTSYEDFKENFHINVPENFNYGFDVVDKLAETKPDQPALVWCDENNDSATFTFADMKRYSNQTANYFKSLGIGKGDAVMLILKRRFEYWFCLLA
ncbi:MAG TPA: AMP-binding protein, partial [Armatimonadota bacterium]|nr:AMP-binding protein [Armatimonadota bacterium]